MKAIAENTAVCITISASLLADILGEAAAAPDFEICGLLFGSPDRIHAAEKCANVADSPDRTFEIDPVRLIAAHRAERQGGARLIGHYHSHPSGLAEPSAADAAAASPGQLWLIVGGGVARLWLAQASGFAEVMLLAR